MSTKEGAIYKNTVTPEITGTFSYDETNALEQTVLTVTITYHRRVAIWLDFVNVTQNTTILIKHAIDGTNYRTFENDAWTPALEDGVYITDCWAYRNVRVTFQCGGGGGGSVNVPYAVV